MEVLVPAFSLADLPPESVVVKEAYSEEYSISKGMKVLQRMEEFVASRAAAAIWEVQLAIYCHHCY